MLERRSNALFILSIRVLCCLVKHACAAKILVLIISLFAHLVEFAHHELLNVLAERCKAARHRHVVGNYETVNGFLIYIRV